MDLILVYALLLTPLFAWAIWLSVWRGSNGVLILCTALVGIALYIAAGYAIHANKEFWGPIVIKGELESIERIEWDTPEEKAEAIESTRNAIGRRIYSLTQLSIPIISTGWYSIVLIVAAASYKITTAFRAIARHRSK